jgi:hypothetical protein
MVFHSAALCSLNTSLLAGLGFIKEEQCRDASVIVNPGPLWSILITARQARDASPFDAYLEAAWMPRFPGSRRLSPWTHLKLDGSVVLPCPAIYPQFHTRPIGVTVQHGPKLPPL